MTIVSADTAVTVQNVHYQHAIFVRGIAYVDDPYMEREFMVTYLLVVPGVGIVREETIAGYYQLLELVDSHH